MSGMGNVFDCFGTNNRKGSRGMIEGEVLCLADCNCAALLIGLLRQLCECIIGLMGKDVNSIYSW